MGLRKKLKAIRIGVSNLIAYAPLIWRDRDHGWAFLAELLEFKLRRMALHMMTPASCSCPFRGNEEAAKDMWAAAERLRDMIDNKFTEEYFEGTISFAAAENLAFENTEEFGKLMAKIQNWWG